MWVSCHLPRFSVELHNMSVRSDGGTATQPRDCDSWLPPPPPPKKKQEAKTNREKHHPPKQETGTNKEKWQTNSWPKKQVGLMQNKSVFSKPQNPQDLHRNQALRPQKLVVLLGVRAGVIGLQAQQRASLACIPRSRQRKRLGSFHPLPPPSIAVFFTSQQKPSRNGDHNLRNSPLNLFCLPLPT